jgi:hypothetical protein
VVRVSEHQHRLRMIAKRSGCFLILVVFPAAIVFLTFYAQIQTDRQPEAAALEAPNTSLSQQLSDAQFYEDIANPRLSSKEEVSRRITAYENLLGELNQLTPASEVDAERKANIERATSLITRFLDFSKETDSREVIFIGDRLTVNLPRKLDPSAKRRVLAVVQEKHEAMLKKWKAEIRLPLPAGFLFVKIYEHRDEMARDYQLGPEVAGVAFPCRYIAVALPYPEEQSWGWLRRFFIEEEFEQTVAHEFVHSFCHIAVGFKQARDLPRWFQEGFALYFSGESRVRTALEGPGGVTIRDVGSTEEYQEFRGLFQFIWGKYGETELYEFVRASLHTGSVDQALAEVLQLSGKAGLIGAAATWSVEKREFQERLILAVIFFALVALGVLRDRWARWRWVAVLFIVWAATLQASLSPYYVHTTLWWMPLALSFPLAYLILRHVQKTSEKEPERIKLMVEPDWPRPDQLMESWPYEEVDLTDILEAGYEAGQWYGQQEFADGWARRLKAFLESQPTNVFYYEGHAYRVWYEMFGAGEDEEA